MDLNYQASVESLPLPGRPFPHLGEGPDEQEMGGGIGRSVEGAAGVVQRNVDAVMGQARQTQLTDAHNQMQALSLQLTHDPNTGAFAQQGKNAFNLPAQYLPQFDDQAQKIVAGVPDPRARQAATIAMGQLRNSLSEQLDAHELEQHRQFGLQTANSSVSLAQQAAAANYNHPDIIATNLDHVDASIDSLSKQQGWSQDKLDEARYRAHVTLHQGVLTNMLADGKVDMAKAYLGTVGGELKPTEMRKATQAIQAGQIKAAAGQIVNQYGISTSQGQKALLNLDQQDLDPQVKAQVIQAVERGRNDLIYQRSQQFDKPITAIEARIGGGQATASDRSQADMIYEHGGISQQQHFAMIDGIERSLKKSEDASNQIAYAGDAVTNRRPLDPRDSGDKAAVNAYFGHVTQNVSPGTPAYVNQVKDIVGKVGVVPEDAVSWTRANLSGGDPMAAANAAALLDTSARVNSRAVGFAFDAETRAMAHTINTAVGAGTDPQVAVNLARDNAKLGRTQTELLDKAWNKAIPQNQTELRENSLIRGGLNDDAHYNGGGIPLVTRPGVPEPPAAMTAEFNDLAKQYFYHTGGDLKSAQQLALNDLKGVWGVSTVNGSRQLMKYAPERMFPGLTADMIHSDLADSDHGDAHLAESARTGITGGREWNLEEKDQFGAYDVVRDKNQMPLRYSLPEPSKAEARAQQDQDKKDRAQLVVKQQLKELENQREQQNLDEGEGMR